MKICNPIFIVGCGRSGSTLLYEILAGHKDLTWFSNYTNAFKNQPWLSSLNILYKNPILLNNLKDHKIIPFVIPSEGHDLWDLFHPLREDKDPPLFEYDVRDANVELMKSIIIKHLKYSKCNRFLNKNTRNTRRSLYLQEIFPDALFIHIIRDGRAVINSFLNVHFWENLHLWYDENFRTPSQLVLEGENEINLAAKLWKYEVERMLSDSKKINKDQYFEVRYEKFTKEPISTLREILDFCNLNSHNDFFKFIKSFNINDMNFKWRESFTNSNIKLIEKEAGSLLLKLNYI